MNIIIPFNLKLVENNSDLLSILIYAAEADDEEIIYTGIDSITDDTYETEEELDRAKNELIEIAMDVYSSVYCIIKPLSDNNCIKDGFVIEDIFSMGNDTVLKIDYW